MKVFKEISYTATVNKLDKSLIGRNMIDMLPAKLITYVMIKMSLVYLMFLKRKQCGKIKARGCTNSRLQREYIIKLEPSSPYVKTHVLFLSCFVNAFEHKCVVVVNILAAFLSADWQENAPDCHIRFESAMVEMLCQIKPEYWKLIQHTKIKNGGMRKVLVGKLSKKMYGTLLGAVVFYNKLKGVLVNIGFKIIQ